MIILNLDVLEFLTTELGMFCEKTGGMLKIKANKNKSITRCSTFARLLQNLIHLRFLFCVIYDQV